jgi:uncharacterized Zn-binding protein involved in type VI secretion
MSNTTLVNGLSPVTAGSNGTLITGPDVCKTTVGPAVVPIPYPNIAKSADLAKGSTSVTIDGNPVCLESSELSTSTGDEAGNVKGIMSGTINGIALPKVSSPTVFIEGKAVVRNTDMFTSNKDNTPPAPIMQAQLSPSVAEAVDLIEIARANIRYKFVDTQGKALTDVDFKYTLADDDNTTKRTKQRREDGLTPVLSREKDENVTLELDWPEFNFSK